MMSISHSLFSLYRLTRQRTIRYVAYIKSVFSILLVHDRGVGFSSDNTEWKLSQLSLETINTGTGEVIV